MRRLLVILLCRDGVGLVGVIGHFGDGIRKLTCVNHGLDVATEATFSKYLFNGKDRQ